MESELASSLQQFLLSTLSSFQGVLKVSTAVASDLILVEVDGKC